MYVLCRTRKFTHFRRFVYKARNYFRIFSINTYVCRKCCVEFVMRGQNWDAKRFLLEKMMSEANLNRYVGMLVTYRKPVYKILLPIYNSKFMYFGWKGAKAKRDFYFPSIIMKGNKNRKKNVLWPKESNTYSNNI